MKRAAKLLIFTAILSVFLSALFACDDLDLSGVQITIDGAQGNDGTSDNNTYPDNDTVDTDENHGDHDGKHDDKPIDPIEPGDDPVEPGDDPVEPGDDPVEPGDDPVEPGDDPIELPVTEKVDVTFWLRDITIGDESVHTVISVDKGSAISDIPAVPLFNGALSGSWSLSAYEYIAPDFSSVNEDMAVYAYYERSVFSITYSYSASKGDYPSGVSNPSTYSAGDILTLLDLTANEGYEFKGWYDTDGNKVSEITAYTRGDLYLTAKWSLIEYTITYDCGNGSNSPNNVTANGEKKYTVESPTHTLADASLTGYSFLRWEDEHGNTVTKIEKGTTGDIHLKAIWTSMRYVTVPVSEIQNPMYGDSFYYDAQNDIYTFVYYLGCVENVPMSDATYIFYNGMASVSLKYDVSYTTQVSIEKSLTMAKESTVSTNVSSSISAKEEVEIPGSKTSVEASISASIGTSLTVSESASISNAVEKTSQTSSSFELTIPDGSPSGYYRTVYMGTIDVFSAIVYDAKSDTYEIVEYTLIRDTLSIALDYSTSSSFDDHLIETIEFDIPEEAEDYIVSLTEKTDGLVFHTGTGLVKAYTGTATDVVIPSYYDGVKITGLADGVFAGNSTITSVKLGQFISDISANAFCNCTALQSIEWSDCVESISESAFYGCISLNTQLPDTVTSIASNAFTDCTSLESVTISENITSLGENVFSGCTNLNLTVYPCSNEMLTTSAISGAGYITIDCTRQIGSDGQYASIGSVTIQVPDTTDTFTIIGVSDTAYSEIYLISNAQNTVITNISVTNTSGGTGLQIYSANTVFTNVSVVMSGNSGNAVQFFHENADLTIHKTVTLTGGNSSSAKGGSGLIAVNITIHSRSTYDAATLTVTAGSGSPGGDAIVVESTIEVQHNVDMTVAGGNGNSGKNGAGATYISAANGYNGGIGIVATNLIISASEYDMITISGGNGGNAYNRAIGDNDGDGSDGRDGYTGGKGGNAVSLETLIVESGNPEFIGGDGGRGGDASEGNANGDGIFNLKNKQGGNGGNGGAGAIAISASTLTVKNTSTLNATGGNGGNGGTRGGMHDEGAVRTGSQGSGGAGGEALSSSCSQKIDDSATVNLNSGSAGSAGTGTKWC